MCFDYAVAGNAGLTFEGVDILCEAGIQEAMICEELHKGMRERGPKLAWIQFSGEGIN